ncbi:hypothetical protein [Cohnella ginsengisoli]|uniref:hypothetical protein n=1 Tax=Cohnella ginsengisoli TaxID=425004 RepID=UPI0030B87486
MIQERVGDVAHEHPGQEVGQEQRRLVKLRILRLQLVHEHREEQGPERRDQHVAGVVQHGVARNPPGSIRREQESEIVQADPLAPEHPEIVTIIFEGDDEPDHRQIRENQFVDESGQRQQEQLPVVFKMFELSS